MAELGLCHTTEDLGGGQFRATIGLRPTAYLENGAYRAISNDFVDGDGDVNYPHIVTAAPMLVSVAADGKRRIHPTREIDRYIEIGAPYIKPAATWTKVNLGTASRVGNRLQWTTTNAIVGIDMGGHFAKLGVLLRNGWQPPNGQFAFPVSLTGLTRQGANLLADGVIVAKLRAPHVEDYDNPLDVRPIDWQFVNVSGQNYVLFTLPDLAGMSRPLVDPTVETIQPAAAAGQDTIIASNTPTTNYSAIDIYVGESSVSTSISRTLIKFDMSSIPAAAAISSAVLSLYATQDISTTARTFRVYRQKRAWVEAQSTWNIYSTGNNWATAGGFGSDDCEQTDIGSRDFTATETLNQFKNFALTPATKAGLDLGNGWLIKADTEDADQYKFASSDDATAANRPKLVITYTLPAANSYWNLLTRLCP